MTSPRRGSNFAKGGYNKPGPDGILQNDKGSDSPGAHYTSQEHSKRLTVLKRGQEGGPGSGAQPWWMVPPASR